MNERASGPGERGNRERYKTLSWKLVSREINMAVNFGRRVAAIRSPPAHPPPLLCLSLSLSLGLDGDTVVRPRECRDSLRRVAFETWLCSCGTARDMRRERNESSDSHIMASVRDIALLCAQMRAPGLLSAAMTLDVKKSRADKVIQCSCCRD